MASRRHSIPGTYSSHPLVHPSSFCHHMADMQISDAAELSHQNNNKNIYLTGRETAVACQALRGARRRQRVVLQHRQAPSVFTFPS